VGALATKNASVGLMSILWLSAEQAFLRLAVFAIAAGRSDNLLAGLASVFFNLRHCGSPCAQVFPSCLVGAGQQPTQMIPQSGELSTRFSGTVKRGKFVQ
jgi:hypothetical protein